MHCIAKPGGGGRGAVSRVCAEAKHAAPHLARPREHPASGEGRVLIALSFPHIKARFSHFAAVELPSRRVRGRGEGGKGGALALVGSGCFAGRGIRGEPRGSQPQRR